MSETLLPCPFCDGEAVMVKTQKCGRYVECFDCGGRTGEYETDYAGSSAYDKAQAAWSKRAVKPTVSLEKLAEIIVGLDTTANLGYCKSNCEEVNGCPHPVKCCTRWLMEEVE